MITLTSGRYIPLRLHTSTITLATPATSLTILSSHTTFSVPFDLRLPGWLPPSHVSAMTNTSYGALAQATVGWADSLSAIEALHKASSKHRDPLFPNPSLSSQHTAKGTSQFAPFEVLRHSLPSALRGFETDRVERHFTLKQDDDCPSPVECVVSVPDWVDVNGGERSLRIALRLRARKTTKVAKTSGSAQGDAAELDSVPMERQTEDGEDLTKMLELGMEVEQLERYSYVFGNVPADLSDRPLPNLSSHPFPFPRNSLLATHRPTP
jgi:hypothetical protein